MTGWRAKGLKSPALPGEGSGDYGEVNVDREGVTLAEPFLSRQPFPNLLAIGRQNIVAEANDG